MRRITMLAALLLASACVTVQPMTPAQRRAIQMRTFSDASYDNVFRSFKSILQDQGYVIKNQDMTGGLIVATIDKTDAQPNFQFVLGSPDQASQPQNEKMGEQYQVSVNLEKINNATVETRMTIQKVDQYSMGGRRGQEVMDAKMYQQFYDQVRTEIARRKAQGKG